MTNTIEYAKILTGNEQLGPYPIEKIKKVDKPTTLITDNVQQFDQREQGFFRAARGDFGITAKKEWLRISKMPIEAAEMDVSAHLTRVVDGKIASSKAPLPENPEIISNHIKRLGYFLRADMVGICQLPKYAIYSYDIDGKLVELNHKFAIVILIDQDYETMKGSSGCDWISGCQSFLSYSTTGFIAAIMANYIRRLGYPARAHHQPGYQVIVPPLVLLAGLGEMSRMGNSVLNPFLGVRFKGAVVTTDLPLQPDKPIDFGLQKFCTTCKKCAIACPAKAIPIGDKVMYNGYETWRLDVKRCTQFRVINQSGAQCGRCIKVCPWNKPKGWTHDMVRRIVKNVPSLNQLIVKIDDLWGYGKQDIRKKWWFDLQDVNGTLQMHKKNTN